MVVCGSAASLSAVHSDDLSPKLIFSGPAGGKTCAAIFASGSDPLPPAGTCGLLCISCCMRDVSGVGWAPMGCPAGFWANPDHCAEPSSKSRKVETATRLMGIGFPPDHFEC